MKRPPDDKIQTTNDKKGVIEMIKMILDKNAFGFGELHSERRC